MKLKDKIRTSSFIKTYGSGDINPQKLKKIFDLSADKILAEESKHKNLLYPLKPRAIEARQVMVEVLDAEGLNYMIECPTHSPLQKLENRASRVDLSIFSEKGIVDIEFKQSPSDIDRDFPKLLSPSSIGCASFYLFNGKKIDKQLSLIMDRFQAAYNRSIGLNDKFSPFLDKWYLVYLVAIEEKRIYYQNFNSFKNVIFSDIIEKI
jgi:hypothetical protein